MRIASMLGLVMALGMMGTWGADAPKNLIANPSFAGAAGEHGLPNGWWGPGGEPTDGYKVAVVTAGRTGGKALQIEGSGTYGLASADRVEIDRAKRYTARGSFKVEGADAKATIKFDYFDEQGNYVASSDYGQMGPKPEGWWTASIQDRAEDYPKAKTLGLCCVLLGKGRAIFDGLELTAAPIPTANLLSNGDMENVLGDQVAGYWPSSNDGGKATWTASSDKPKTGHYCLHVKGSCEWTCADSGRIKREKGKTYVLTGWVRVKSGEPASRSTVSRAINGSIICSATTRAAPIGSSSP